MRLLPTLQLGPCAGLSEIRPATLRVTVRQLGAGEGVLLHDETYAIRLHAFDTALLGISTPEGSIVDLSDHLAAFVTPHAWEIENLLRLAVNYHPQRQMLGYQNSGEQDGPHSVLAQVQAMYRALKQDAGLVYIDSSLNFGKQEGQITQRVRLPRSSLHDNQSRANCIDGAVLYASLLELANLQPLLAIVPGHAFVGWRIARNADQYDFLETTSTGSEDFERALEKGRKHYKRARDRGYFGRELFDARGFARLVDVADCRAKGINPLL